MDLKIGVIKGDGIGPEIVAEAMKVPLPAFWMVPAYTMEMSLHPRR